MLYAHAVILNELAQGLRTTAEGVEWFERLSEEDQGEALHALGVPLAGRRPLPIALGRPGVAALMTLRLCRSGGIPCSHV